MTRFEFVGERLERLGFVDTDGPAVVLMLSDELADVRLTMDPATARDAAAALLTAADVVEMVTL